MHKLAKYGRWFLWGMSWGLIACQPLPDSAVESRLSSTTATQPTEQVVETADLDQTEDETEVVVDVNRYDDYELVTLLPRDAIPAIDDPRFLNASEADEEYAPDELILGVFLNGEARAYSVPHLSGREIVNDTVGGVKIAVTW